MKIKDNDAFLMAMGVGSRIELHAADADKVSFTELKETSKAGENTILLTDTTGWEAGDRIAISSSDYRSEQAEDFTIVEISGDGKTLTLDKPLQYMHFGNREVVSNGRAGADKQSWQINESAEVALLSRNVEISGDADSVDDGFGGHTMVMAGAEMHISGVEFDMMGQKGTLGRYVAHWHMLGDAGAGQYIQNSSIHHTYAKAVTIHGTHHTRVEGNVVFDTQGHGFFLEDGSETGNLLKNNIAFGQQAVDASDAVIMSDTENVSSFWITNPDNDLIGNVAAGSQNAGFWYAIGEDFTGLSKTDMRFDNDPAPFRSSIGLFQKNEAHSNIMGLAKTTNPDEGGAGRIVIKDRDFIVEEFASFRNSEWSTNLDNLVGDVDFYNAVIGAAGDGLLFNSDVSIIGSLIYGETDNTGNPDTPGERAAGKSFADDTGKDAGSAEGLAFYSGRFDLDDSHFAKFGDPKHNFLAVGKGAGTEDFVGRITFDETTDATDLAFLPQAARAGRQGHAIFDEFGDLSGVPGAYLTSAWFSSHASAGAYEHPDFNGYVITDARVVQLFEDGRTGDVGPDSLIRYDAVDGPRTDGDPGTGTRTQLVMLGDGNDYVYAYDFGDRALEHKENGIKLVGAFDTEYVFIEALHASENHYVPGAIRVGSFDQLKVAPSKAYYYEDERIYVKLFGGDSKGKVATDPNRLEFELGTRSQEVVEVPEDAYSPLKYTLREIRSFLPDTSRPIPPDTSERTAHDLSEKALKTSKTIDPGQIEDRWSDATTWGGAVPDENAIVVIKKGDAVLLDQDVTVQGIVVEGGALVAEDVRAIALSADWILVINEGLFQVGREDQAHVNDFKLTMEGDDPSQDLDIAAILSGSEAGVVFSNAASSSLPDTSAVSSHPGSEDPPQASDPLPTLVAAMNVGGEAYTSNNGVRYDADTSSVGRTYEADVAIGGTEDDTLYQSERWNAGGFALETPVENGVYDLELNFAEIWFPATQGNRRLFDVYVEDKLVYDDLDVASEAGYLNALDIVGRVEVTDGSLSIRTTAEQQNPILSAYALWVAQGELSENFTQGALHEDLSFA